MDSDAWCLVTVIFVIICWAASIVFTYFVSYADVYPLSSTAAHVKDHHSAYEAGRYILGTVVGFGLLLATLGATMLVESKEVGCWGCLGLCFLLLLLGFPFWMQIAIEPGMYDRAWNSGCNGWAIDAVLNARSIVGLNVSLGVAAIVLSPESNYSMQLIAFSPEMYSFSVINSFNYTPPLSTIIYNNETHAFTADNRTKGDFIVAPQLSFPSLNLESLAPSYVDFETAGGSALAWLSHNRTVDVLYTVTNYLTITNYSRDADNFVYNASLLKVCGSLEWPDEFQIALGAVFIQHQLDSLYQHGLTPALVWPGRKGK